MLSDFTFLLFFPSCFFVLIETKRNGIDAVTFSSWPGPVFKNMPKVASAARTDHFNPVHKMAGILLKPDFVAGNHIRKTWPPGAGLKFGIGRKEFLPAGSTGIDPFFFVIIKVAGKGPFRAFLSQDLILLGSENLFPLFFGLLNFILFQI